MGVTEKRVKKSGIGARARTMAGAGPTDLNDMGQLHYVSPESVITIACQMCYWTSVEPFCEEPKELYNRLSVVWCTSALVHVYVPFCIHIACGMPRRGPKPPQNE